MGPLRRWEKCYLLILTRSTSTFVVLSTVPEAMPANYEFAWHRLIFW